MLFCRVLNFLDASSCGGTDSYCCKLVLLRAFQRGEHSDPVPLLNKLAHMITSVMSWDQQKTLCNDRSSEDALIRERSHKYHGARFTGTDKTWPAKITQRGQVRILPGLVRTHFSSLSSFPVLMPRQMSWRR